MKREAMIALVRRQAMAWQTRDPQAISQDFAPDGVLISPSEALTGPDAVRVAAESVFAAVIEVRITIKRIVIEGDQGAVEWTWQEIDATTGQQRTMEDAIIFTVQNEKILYWREYIEAMP